MAYLPCPECRRHVHVDERACPFCAREVRLGRTSKGAIAFFACALALGCKDKPKEAVTIDPATVKSAAPSISLTPKEEEQAKAALKEELKRAIDPRQADIYGAPPVPPATAGSTSASASGSAPKPGGP